MSKNRSRRGGILKVRLDEAELDDLRSRAATAGLDRSKFVRQSIQGSRIVNRGEWRQLANAVSEANVLLARLSRDLEEANPLDAFGVGVTLLQIERALRVAVSRGRMAS
jgi:hypothetical protein